MKSWQLFSCLLFLSLMFTLFVRKFTEGAHLLQPHRHPRLRKLRQDVREADAGCGGDLRLCCGIISNCFELTLVKSGLISTDKTCIITY